MDLVQVVSQVGFPIAVATYSLVVLNKTIQKNTEETQKNTLVVNQLLSKLEGKEENK
jgi:hypothetical protein